MTGSTSDPLKRLIPEEEARSIILSIVKPKKPETTGLTDAHGSVLADDLKALRTQPPFDASAMDGYAVRQEDISDLPAKLRIVGQSRAGEPFEGAVGNGEAVRIFTGAVVPEGADSIVIQENTETDGVSVVVNQDVSEGKYIRKAGLDFNEGDILLHKGEKLTPARLALAASMNHANVPVIAKPRVALLSTGDELVFPGKTTAPGQIIASNTFGLAASISATRADLHDYGIVADTRQALQKTLKTAIDEGCDLIVTTGGASVGDHDLILPVAQNLGFEFSITKIAVRPGKPFLFGTLQHSGRTIHLAGLAGNPVSSLVGYNVFVRPIIQLLACENPENLFLKPAVLGRDLPANDERAEYMRAILQSGKNGELFATPFEMQDSSMLANLVRADCLVYRPVLAPAAFTGDPCQIVVIG